MVNRKIKKTHSRKKFKIIKIHNYIEKYIKQASVTMPPASVWVTGQRPLAPSATSVTSVG